MRNTEFEDRPVTAANSRELQCVAFLGFVESVRWTISSTRSSESRRGVPERGSSVNPPMRSLRKRSRHLPTVCCVMPSWSATSELVFPLPHSKTIRARSANCRDTVRRRAIRSSAARSLSLSSSGCKERPRVMSKYRAPVINVHRTSGAEH
jgi:hypothetical protein